MAWWISLERPEDAITPSELRWLRNEAARGIWWSQPEFASWLGVTKNTVARMERGELSIRVSTARLAIYCVAEATDRAPEQVREQLEALRTAAAKKKKRATKKKAKRTKTARRLRKRSTKARPRSSSTR